MKYDITTNKAPEMPNLGRGTECIKLLLSQASKDMHDPLFRCFFPLLAHIPAAQKFSVSTTNEGYFAAKWPIELQKVGVTRDNCHIC